ncbi:unnamed protein product [marine sediment metagenome]|uniref:Uncharacterized protein n=1 Tax=marine sediment metagenome TaxID=412755 RepID=X1PRF7_9ZZZZ
MVSEERIKKLEEVLANYPDILSEFEIKEQIINAFKFEKPLTSIELEGEDKEKVAQLIEELENFFFTGRIYFEPDSQESAFSGLIFISRFKNLFEAAMNYAKKHDGLLDEFADLSGILFGYSSKEVAEYCSEERLRKYKLLK